MISSKQKLNRNIVLSDLDLNNTNLLKQIKPILFKSNIRIVCSLSTPNLIRDAQFRWVGKLKYDGFFSVHSLPWTSIYFADYFLSSWNNGFVINNWKYINIIFGFNFQIDMVLWTGVVRFYHIIIGGGARFNHL